MLFTNAQELTIRSFSYQNIEVKKIKVKEDVG